MKVPISVRTSYSKADLRCLVDSGATDNFIHPRFLRRMGLGTRKLTNPKRLYNVDDTTNRAGQVTDYVDLDVRTNSIHKEMRFLVSDIGREDAILGYPWLATFEPHFSWRHGAINTSHLPIVLNSVNPRLIRRGETIAALRTEDKQEILDELARDCTARGASTELAINAQPRKEVTLPPEYQRFASVFSEEESQRFPPSRTWDHAITLKSDAPEAINCKVYPMTKTEDEALDAFLDEQLAKGYIRPSISPYASSFFFIKKKDGKLRPVQDYRVLNKWTVRNQYPLPLITALIRDLGGAHIYTKLDVRWGYNNVRIKEGDEYKAAFKTRRGLFEPTVMFFGLTNSPATFQAMMNSIYQQAIAKHEGRGTNIRIYMDDIAVATKNMSLSSHVEAVSDVLQVAKDHSLFFKLSKCSFHVPSIDYLGLVLEKGTTKMDPVKLAGIRDWPTPKTVKDVRSFHGFCNFYRSFIRGFSKITLPLNALTKKGVEFQWTRAAQEAFDTLKEKMTEAPVLAHPDLTKPFELEVDASGYAIGAVLLQRQEDGKRHPVNYFSTTLNAAERNYDIYDLELLAIVKSLRNSRSLLAGSPHEIKVYSDHLNLQHWRDPQKISRRVAREVVELADYPIKIYHVAGKANGRADALSRRSDYDQGERDNEDVIVLPDALFARSAKALESPQDEKQIAAWVDPHQLKKIDGLWRKGNRTVITTGLEEKRQLISTLHDPPAYGHPGISRTTDFVERRYWWPNLRREVADYVRGCGDCQRHKVNNRPTKAPLQPIYPSPEAKPFEVIAVDFITKLPPSQGFDSILTVTDHSCTKAVRFIPCTEAITAEGTAKLFLQQIFCHYGLPTKIISDRDPRFTSRFTKELCRLLAIRQNISTAYHPRTDGQSERNNQWVETYLRFFVNHQQDNWADYLPIAEFAHNNWRSETTRESPFFLLMGYHPRADWQQLISNLPLASTRLEQIKKIRNDAQHHMTRAQNLWIKHKTTPKYKEGDQVWLEGRNLRIDQPAVKLAPRRHGPFRVAQVMSPVSYRLVLPPQWKIHPVFHIDLLSPYRETEIHGRNYPRPPPELVDNEEEYEVENILDSRKTGRGRKLQYLIKWKGYPDADNQWEDSRNVSADELVRQFQRRNPTKETHLRRLQTGKSPSHHSMSSPAQLNTQSSEIILTFITCNRCGSTSDYCHCANDNVDSPRTRSPFSDDAVLVPTLDNPTDEGRTQFPTPEPGRISPDSTHTTRIELGDTTEIREVRMDEGDERVEEGADTDSPPSYGRPATIFPDCTCGAEGGEYCHCAERCARGAGEPCEFVRELRTCLTHEVVCLGCRDPMRTCRCDALPVLLRHNHDLDGVNQVRGRGETPFRRSRSYEEAVEAQNEEGADDAATEETAVEVRPVRRGARGGQAARRGRGVRPPTARRPANPQPAPRVPEEFWLNVPPRYIPFKIWFNGREVEARYVTIHMTNDPYALGMTAPGAPVYRRPAHAAPRITPEEATPATAQGMRILHYDYSGKDWVNDALTRLRDDGLRAEVHRYRKLQEELHHKLEEVKRLEDRVADIYPEMHRCCQRLQRAEAVDRVESQRGEEIHLISPWTFERGRST
jgi:hypothetical protein